MIIAHLKYNFWTSDRLDSDSIPSHHGIGFDNCKIVKGKIDITKVTKTGLIINGSKLAFTPFIFDEIVDNCTGVAFVESMIDDLTPLDSESEREIKIFRNLLLGIPHEMPQQAKPNSR